MWDSRGSDLPPGVGLGMYWKYTGNGKKKKGFRSVPLTCRHAKRCFVASSETMEESAPVNQGVGLSN